MFEGGGERDDTPIFSVKLGNDYCQRLSVLVRRKEFTGSRVK